jgi:hypothetical protein
MTTYVVFRRTATNWSQFATARKRVIRRGLSLKEARYLCNYWNTTRTPQAVRSGTKYEFTQEERIET